MRVVESQGNFRQMFLVQSTIGCRDLHAQLKKLWNLCNNLDFKENIFYPLYNINSETEHFRASKDQRLSSRPTMVGSEIRQFGHSLYHWTGPYLTLPKLKFCIEDSEIYNKLFAKLNKVFSQ